MAFAIYGSSQLFCVVWQVMLLASFAVITYAYLRIEVLSLLQSEVPLFVITYAYLRIEVKRTSATLNGIMVITYAYLRIEVASVLIVVAHAFVITYAYLRIEVPYFFQSAGNTCYNLRISAD